MNICFVGNEEKGYFAEEVARELKGSCRYVKEALSVQQQVNEILAEPVDFVVYDISQYTISPDVIAVDVLKIQNANNAKTVIYASGYLPQSTLVQTLLKKGFNLFVLSTVPSGKKDQLHKCINGFYEANHNPVLEICTSEEIAENVQRGGVKTIAVVGVMSRIGTTTQALQIIKYLMLNGWKACYIEMNSTGYVEYTRQLDDNAIYDESLQKVTTNGIDMFFNMDRLREYLKLDYDYFVYDYGVYNDRDFNKVSYLEKEIKIAVCGFKYNEIAYTMEFLRNPYYTDIYYIFSFIDANTRKTIKLLMQERAEKTFFAENAPDSYYFKNDSNIYSQMIACEKNECVVGKKGFRLFRKR